jgi:hypothetical protein
MRRWISILPALLACPLLSPHTAAQTRETAASDSDRVVVVDPGLSLGTPVLILPRSLDERTAFIVPPFVTPAWSPESGLPFVMGPAAQKIDMLAPLHLAWEREKRLAPLYTALGAVELGGVAYIAYRHIKKYGLFR